MSIRDEIVACARRQIGASYNYGASFPHSGPASDYDSFNCSGFARAVYEECGLTIPGWQGHQNADGSQSDWVRDNGNWTDDPDELQPGDLVFFSGSGDPYNTGHVGISTGGWGMIDSVPDGGVQERTLYGTFVGGGWPLAEVPDGSSGKDWVTIPARGTVRFDQGMNVRDYPSTEKGNVVASYEAGEELNLDGIVLNDGYAWAHYVGASSGKDRYIALAGDFQFAKGAQ